MIDVITEALLWPINMTQFDIFCDYVQEYSPEDASISDPDNKIILKFLHDLDPQQGDKRSRPGSDLSYYLHDLKSRGNRFVNNFVGNG